MAIINKIKVGNTEYDIEASAIGNLSNLTVESNATQETPDVTIQSDNSNNSANIVIKTASTDTKATLFEGYAMGEIKLNAKGNLAVESLSKHVNLEAAKGIQIKPTTNVIFDSSRRIMADSGNEVHMQFVFDDYDSGNTGHHTGDDEAYAELKVEARNIDLRCYDHGGIAIQPCGKDGNNFENKIKFESSRLSAIDEVSPDFSPTGGDGLEFGTFNNLHTSLFTGDYRFNKDGMVYAVTRGQIETSGTGTKTKADYPTQGDDFKDVPINLQGTPAVYDTQNKVWNFTGTPVSTSWETIVKTAMVFDSLSQKTNPTAQDLLDSFNDVFNPSAPL
jgi:hypothetical protein